MIVTARFARRLVLLVRGITMDSSPQSIAAPEDLQKRGIPTGQSFVAVCAGFAFAFTLTTMAWGIASVNGWLA